MTIIKKFNPDQYSQKFPKKYIILTVVCLFALILIEIWASNTLVEFGAKLENTQAIKKTLQTENQILENEIAMFSSLTSTASSSAILGFSKPEKIQYIR